MGKGLTSNEIDEDDGRTIKEYWVWSDDKRPFGLLKVEGGKLVLSDETLSSPCESVANADDIMEPLLAEYREEEISDLYMQISAYTSEEELDDLRDRIEYAIDAAQEYVQEAKVRNNTAKLEQIYRYIEGWRKLSV